MWAWQSVNQPVSDNDAWGTGDIQDMKTKVGAGKEMHVAINLMNLQRRTFLQTIQPRVAGPAATSTPSPNTLQQPWSLQSTHVLVQFQMPKNRVPSMCPRFYKGRYRQPNQIRIIYSHARSAGLVKSAALRIS